MNRAVAFVVDSRVVVGAVIVAVLTWLGETREDS